MGTTARRALAAVAVTAAGLAMVNPAQAGATTRDQRAEAAAVHWAPAATAPIHPGVSITIGGVECLAGYVLRERQQVFLTTTAGCAGITPGEDVNGCSRRESAGVDPLGTTATIEGARHLGTYVYSSRWVMKLHPPHNRNRCHYDNLALVKLDWRDIKRVNPSLPGTGGPTGVSKVKLAAPDTFTVFAPAATMAHALQTGSGGWAYSAMVDGHISPNTAGAPALASDGSALGLVTVVPPQGTVGETIVSSLHKEMHFLRQTAGYHHVHLVHGTEDYAGS